MKGGVKLTTSPEKTTFKNPSLIKVKSFAILTMFSLLTLGIFFYLICYATKSFELNATIREIKFLTSFEFIQAYICFISSQE